MVGLGDLRALMYADSIFCDSVVGLYVPRFAFSTAIFRIIALHAVATNHVLIAGLGGEDRVDFLAVRCVDAHPSMLG